LAWLQAALRWPGHALATVLVYKTIAQKATGGKLKQVISGGGSLARHLDLFFEAIGVELLVGYGLTETAPILTVRRSEHNLRGSAGLPLAQTEIKIVHPETRQPLGLEERGLVLARGPQIMQGYFKNPEATAKAIDSEGWFDTGDLGMVVPQGDLVLTGRAKDTIVLTNGENIEPQPIEDACLRSPYVDQIMLVGQDQKSLGALIVPNCAALQQWASSQNLSLDLPEDLSEPLSPAQRLALETPQVQDLIRQELARQVKDRPSYRADDRITVFRLLPEPFSMVNGMMTQTLKIRRPVVTERYQAMIDEMFS
jgi:long-chain acyl-CoA synthetase